MKWFSNLRIKVKLITCFIILAIFTGVVGYIGINNMSIINDRGDDMYVNNFLPAQDLAQIQTNLQYVRVNYYLMLFEQDMSTLQQRQDEITKWAEATNNKLASYEKNIRSQEERAMFADIKSKLVTYREKRGICVDLIKTGNYAEAKVKTADFAKAREELDAAVQKLVDFNIKVAADKSEQNTKDYKSQSVIMLSIIAAGVLLAIGLGLLVANMISKPVNKLLGAANKIADGNLDVDIRIDTKDEVGNLATAFIKMSDTLNDVMSKISSAAEQVASGSKQVSDSSMALSQGATEQASSIEELTASLEEIASQTKLNAENASEANELAELAKTNAVVGNEQMQEMLKAMVDINDSSSSISKIIKVIDEIAFQTNILALNAAVEAARAGQHGKGFAVVAEEVRNLAARSANAAKETTDMIEGSIKKVEGGTKIANDTAKALNEIVDNIAKVANIVSNIAVASNEQAAGIAQINQGVMQVSEVVQTNSATSEESAAASEELAGQAELLREQVSKFRLRRYNRSSTSLADYDEINPDVMKMLDKMGGRKKAAKAFDSDEAAATSNTKKIALSDTEFGKY